MFQLKGKYERDEIWASFEVKEGSKTWPSSDPNDSPIDMFTCKKCGKVFHLQMCGGIFIGQTSFQDTALIILSEHMNIKHGGEDVPSGGGV